MKNLAALLCVGLLLCGGSLQARSLDATSIVTKYAEQGDAEAQFVLARLYADGRGVPQSDDLALLWYERAARAGLADAQHRLGSLFLKGRLGLLEDSQEAFQWFSLAAAQEHKVAQYFVGNALIKGDGVAQDVELGLQWLHRAAGNDCKRAKARLGQIYDLGIGVQEDDAKAVSWYLQAATHNMSFAQRALGRMYRHGEGVPVDTVEAVKWYRLAADRDKPDAQFALGEIYLHGEGGIAADRALAEHWLARAAQLAYQPAIDLLARIQP